MTRREWLDKNFEKIKVLYPDVKTVYGPYNNSKDGRSRITLYNGKSRRTKQYARLKMEVKIKRVLLDDETVDHDDGDFLNDRYDNLILRTRKDHIALDVKRRDYAVEDNCKWCGILFNPNVKQVREIRKKKKAGPFCSKSCSGKYGAYIQGGGKALDRTKYAVIYYTDKERR